MTPIRAALLALACLLPLTAAAQWQWLDKSGRRVFSDQPPPADIPPKNILKQPSASTPAATTPEAPAAPPGAAAAPTVGTPKVTGKDRELEEKKRQVQAAEAEKKKAEEEKFAAVRAENCARSKRAKATFDTGVRIVQTNDKGEREILDDRQRAAEIKRIEETIARDCSPAQ